MEEEKEIVTKENLEQYHKDQADRQSRFIRFALFALIGSVLIGVVLFWSRIYQWWFINWE